VPGGGNGGREPGQPATGDGHVVFLCDSAHRCSPHIYVDCGPHHVDRSTRYSCQHVLSTVGFRFESNRKPAGGPGSGGARGKTGPVRSV
jgi:hypothetical protein